MDQDKKLIFLFIYWVIFMFSFYAAFKIRSDLRGKTQGMEIDTSIFGRDIHLKSIDSASRLEMLFYTLSGLALVVSIFMVYIIVNYNYDVVKDKKNLHKEIKEIWDNS